MSTVAEIIARQEHNHTLQRRRSSVYRQSEWGNLSFMYVEPPRLKFCPRCHHSDPMDCSEDFLDRFGVMRRRYPFLEPDQIKEIVRAGLQAEAAVIAKFQGGNRA